jgi:thiamine-monophosphate kinase
VQRLCALQGGDDYELLFTAAPERSAEVRAAARAAGVPVTRIGTLEAVPGVRVFEGDALLAVPARGFDHFAT